MVATFVYFVRQLLGKNSKATCVVDPFLPGKKNEIVDKMALFSCAIVFVPDRFFVFRKWLTYDVYITYILFPFIQISTHSSTITDLHPTESLLR